MTAAGTGRAAPRPTDHTATTADGVALRLRRYRGGDRGPVLLVHGVAVRGDMFALPTIETNLVAYLAALRHDVWVLDWRASIALPLRTFTLDDAAALDMPAAVDRVLELTGRGTLDAVVHCAGSNAFFMSMARRRVPRVRRVVASQVALHLDAPLASVVKARAGLAGWLGRRGVGYMTPAPETESLLRAVMAVPAATHLECSSAFCHRLSFIYGHLYRHAQLNAATHDRLDEQFGRCNIAALQHLSQLVSCGHAREFDHGRRGNLARYGRPDPPDYLDPGPFADVDITFLSGTENRTYLPSSTARTFDWLVEANGSEHYRRHLLPGYGHLDTFMGVDAARDVYPRIADALAG